MPESRFPIERLVQLNLFAHEPFAWRLGGLSWSHARSALRRAGRGALWQSEISLALSGKNINSMRSFKKPTFKNVVRSGALALACQATWTLAQTELPSPEPIAQRIATQQPETVPVTPQPESSMALSPALAATVKSVPEAITEASSPKTPPPAVLPTVQSSPPVSEGLGEEIYPFGKADADMLRHITESITFRPGDGKEMRGDDKRQITLEEAVLLALQNNNEVLAAMEKHVGAGYETKGAKWQFLPSIEVTSDQGTELSAPASYNDLQGNRVLSNQHDRNDVTVVVKQPLFDLALYTDIKISRSKEDVALAEKMDVGEGITVDTTNAYLGLIQAQASVQLAEQYIQYLRKLETTMGVRVEGGAASPADLDRIRGRTMKAEAALVDAQGEYQTSAMEFKRLTGIEPPELLVPVMIAPGTPAKMSEALDAALANNSNYRSTIKKVELADNERSKSLAALAPRLSLQYSHSYSYGAGGAQNGNPLDGLFPSQTTDSLMVVLQWAVYGGNSVAGALIGSAKVREMNYRSLDMRQKMEQGVWAAYTAINAARKRCDILAKNIETDSRVVQTFDEQFLAGSRSLFDLIDAYEQLYSAKLGWMRSTVLGAKTVYQLRRMMGDVVPSIRAMGGK